ncbi:MAG: type II toxin-antitoxin system MqsA family antitoxin [Acidobacteria bacterium]|nr:type II toxin-antitoxin system MqsA family antitoxin [Acidobacteriota bacterium]
MKCTVCRNDETVSGATTVTLERGGRVVVIRGVPAEVCERCGHGSTNAETTERAFEMAELLLAGDEDGSDVHLSEAPWSAM